MTLDFTGDPYWMHPVAVMETLHPDANDEDRMIALLHDVIEDVFEDFGTGRAFVRQKGYSWYVTTGITLLTRINVRYIPYQNVDMEEEMFCNNYTGPKKGKKGIYAEYIDNIIASRHFGAIITKLSDNEHNSNPDRIARISDEITRHQVMEMSNSRYLKSKMKLQEELTYWKGRVREV